MHEGLTDFGTAIFHGNDWSWARSEEEKASEWTWEHDRVSTHTEERERTSRRPRLLRNEGGDNLSLKLKELRSTRKATLSTHHTDITHRPSVRPLVRPSVCPCVSSGHTTHKMHHSTLEALTRCNRLTDHGAIDRRTQDAGTARKTQIISGDDNYGN